MDRSTAIGLGLLALGGVAYLGTRNGGGGSTATEDPADDSPPFGPNLGGLGGLTDGAYAFDPVTGQYYDLANPPPTLGADGLPIGGTQALGPSFSPAFEAAALEEARRANAAAEDEQRRINDRIADDASDAGRYSKAADLASIGLAAAFGAPLLARAGGAIARTGVRAAGAVRNVARGQTSLDAFKSGNAAAKARGAGGAGRTAALLKSPVARFGGAAAVGFAAGSAVNAGIDKAGGYDYLERKQPVKKAIRAVTPKPLERQAEVAVKSVAAATPLPAIGAVAHAAIGRGSVGGNLRQAYRGTVQAKVAKAAKNAAQDASRTVASASTSAAKSTRRFFGRLF